MTDSRTILVIGATGRQGGAVARQLLKRGHAVHALTRTQDSDEARELTRLGAQIVGGDLDAPDTIVEAMTGVDAVFAMTTFLTDAGLDGEVRHGHTLAAAAHQTGVGHVVYSSVDGAERDSGVPHFETKRQIEQRLQELDVPTTVLRPVFFIDNFAYQGPRLVEDTLVLRMALDADTPLQMIATDDIGAFAATAFEHPETWIAHALALAGDELTGPQIAHAFERATGTPTRFEEQPLDEVRAFSEDLALMMSWINTHGYTADVAALRRRRPDLQTLQGWLDETS